MKVCIDPGHGGKDPGAVGSVLKEKGVTLQVSFLLKKALEPDFAVVMTRSDDIYVSLGERCRFANREKADLFVSLHCNSANVHTANGIETFHHPTSRRGIGLAKLIQAELVSATGLKDRGAKYATFQVLRDTAMPAVLIELGFINNPVEEKLLGSFDYQSMCASAIAQGIRRYFVRGSENVG